MRIADIEIYVLRRWRSTPGHATRLDAWTNLAAPEPLIEPPAPSSTRTSTCGTSATAHPKHFCQPLRSTLFRWFVQHFALKASRDFQAMPNHFGRLSRSWGVLFDKYMRHELACDACTGPSSCERARDALVRIRFRRAPHAAHE